MCNHERTFSIGAKASGRFNWCWPNGEDGDGYAPDITSLCGGDYMNLTICIDCKVVIGLADDNDAARWKKAVSEFVSAVL